MFKVEESGWILYMTGRHPRQCRLKKTFFTFHSKIMFVRHNRSKFMFFRQNFIQKSIFLRSRFQKTIVRLLSNVPRLLRLLRLHQNRQQVDFFWISSRKQINFKKIHVEKNPRRKKNNRLIFFYYTSNKKSSENGPILIEFRFKIVFFDTNCIHKSF